MTQRIALTGPGPRPDLDLDLGILAFVDHAGIAARDGRVRSRGLAEGFALFELAEQLGYDVGYVRTRHLQRYLSSPLPFLAALGQHVRRMRLGTQVIPLRFENAGRLAEDLATTDLLLEGRLRAGVGPGYSARDAIYVRAFGVPEGGVREHVDRTLTGFLAFLDGETVSLADTHVETADPGAPLQVQPQVPGLRERLSYGAATVRGAGLAGTLGLGLQLTTMHPDDGSGRPFDELQAELIHAYREACQIGGFGDGHVSVGRLALPIRTDADRELFDGLITEDGWHRRARQEGLLEREIGGGPAVFAPVPVGEPAAVAAALQADRAVAAADELVLSLPMDRPIDLVRRIVVTFAQDVAPLLRTRR